jgi:hypothetical protein
MAQPGVQVGQRILSPSPAVPAGAKRRILVGYGIDVDAVSGHINTTNGSQPDLAGISRGVFGATTGVYRLLNLWERKGIKCSW